jgi:hypothetical protein
LSVAPDGNLNQQPWCRSWEFITLKLKPEEPNTPTVTGDYLAPHIVFIKGKEHNKNFGLHPDSNKGYVGDN